MREKDMPGLAMTRSFGDYFGSIAGVIAEPEVTEYFLKEEDKFMILASDGLFEFMSSQEVVDIVKDYYDKNDIVGCCEYLYNESTRKWLKEEEDTFLRAGYRHPTLPLCPRPVLHKRSGRAVRPDGSAH